MTAAIGQWRYESPEELLRVVDILSRTRGILTIQVFPRKVVFSHQPWSKVDFLGSSSEPVSWRDKLDQIDLRDYEAASLLEGIIFGWEQLRQMGKHATHLIVWDRAEFYEELFPKAGWPHDKAFFDTLYGMNMIDLKQEGIADDDILPGTVVLCGGCLLDGKADDIELGLLIRRRKA